MNWLDVDSTITRVELEDIGHVKGDWFPTDVPTRLDLSVPAAVIPLLVVRRDSQRLTVLNNGAVDLQRSEGRPIFQRSSWWQEIESNQIYVCDPRTVGDGALALPWIQSKPPHWFGPNMSRGIKAVSAALGISRPTDRVYYGSSAGGFTALMQLGSDRNARAVVNNAQFDWTRWFAHHVDPVLEQYFAGRSAAEVREKWPRRVNALQYLSTNERPLRVEYWVNMASEYDREIQFKIFQDFLVDNPHLNGEITVHQYFDEAQGHNPLPRDKTVEIINAAQA